MRILTNLNLYNLRQNRARTIMTIIGVALSVALILASIGFVSSITYTERQESVIRFGDYHVFYKDVPGDKISIIENSTTHVVQFYSEHVGCVETDYGFEDCEGAALYRTKDYTPIYDAGQLIRDADHVYNVFLKYAKPEKADASDNYLCNLLADSGIDTITYRKNSMVASLDGDMPEITRVLYFWMKFFFIGAMSVVGAFVIRNSFNISITERIRQFGMLSSVGARPRQIRRMVLQEGLMIGAIAIPLGILLGCLATVGIVAIVNNLVGFSEYTDMLVHIPLSDVAVIVLAGLFIIILSASSPAIVASRVSPIAALRNVKEVKAKTNKLRTSKLTQKIWGIGGVIAAKNLKRSRSKYRTTVVSIVLSVSVFIGISSFMLYGHKIINLFVEDTGANVIVSSNHTQVFQDVVNHFNIKDYAYYATYQIKGNRESYTGPDITVVSRDEFRRYAQEVGAGSEDYSEMAILQDTAQSNDSHGNYKLSRMTDYKIGDEFTFRAMSYIFDENLETDCNPEDLFKDIDDDQFDESDRELMDKCINHETKTIGGWISMVSDEQKVKITAIADKNPLGISMYEVSTNGKLYISEDSPVAKELKDYSVGGILYIADSGIGDKIGEYLDDEETIAKYRELTKDDVIDATYDNVEEFMKNTRNTILLFEILIYGFIAVVSIIGVTNIFNTITTNVALRAKEFAIMKSIGMTEKEFNHMVRLESVMYTTRALLIGLPIGLIMSYGVSRLFNEAGLSFGWLIPWGSIAICVISVAVLIMAIMGYSVHKIKKQNIIETIREESF